MPYKRKDERNANERRKYHKDVEATRAKSRERVAKFAAQHPERYKAMRSKAAAKWYRNNQVHAINHHKEYRHRIREEVISHYGALCICCGETEFVFLTLDHVNGGGNKHRKLLGGNSLALYLDVRKRGFPPDFQVLCWNCNQAKHHAGICPHRLGLGRLMQHPQIQEKGDYVEPKVSL